MTDPIRTILGDLPTIGRIARRPRQQYPLLELVLAQARALEEIATWAESAERLASAQEPLDVPDSGEVAAATKVADMPPEPTARKRAGGEPA